MTFCRPFIVWTLQRSGGTNLAQHLFDRSGLLALAKNMPHMAEAESRTLECIADNWKLHEPFNAGEQARVFGTITDDWLRNGDRQRLDAQIGQITALGLPVKHCVEMVPQEVSESLLEASCRSGYRHVLLYRKNRVSRLVSLQFARLTGLWGAQMKGDVSFAGRAAGVQLPVAELVLHERLCGERLAALWGQMQACGAERFALAFEDFCDAPDQAASRKRLTRLLGFLELSHGSKSDREFAGTVMRSGKQGTREEYGVFGGIGELAAAMDRLAVFEPRARLPVLAVELPDDRAEVVAYRALDDVPAIVRAKSPFDISGVVVMKSAPPGGSLFLLGGNREMALRWGFDSPRIGGLFPALPHAAKARFRVRGLHLDIGESIEIQFRSAEAPPMALFRLSIREQES